MQPEKTLKMAGAALTPAPAAASPLDAPRGRHAAAAVSAAGRRGYNEDVVLVRQEALGGWPVSLVAVADGMGGHSRGEVAAALTRDALDAAWHVLRAPLAEALAAGDTSLAASVVRSSLHNAFRDAEHRIRIGADGSDMGTTLVAALAAGPLVIIGNVGDSRAYAVSATDAVQLTDDHSAVADAIRQGVLSPGDAANSPYQHALTRSLDGSGDADPDLFPAGGGWMTLGEGTAVLTCSDGLSGVLAPNEIATAFAQTASVHDAGLALVSMAYRKGSADNVSVSIVEIGAMRRSGIPWTPDPVLLHEAGVSVSTASDDFAPSGSFSTRRRSRWLAAGVLATSLIAASAFAWRHLGPQPTDEPARAEAFGRYDAATATLAWPASGGTFEVLVWPNDSRDTLRVFATTAVLPLDVLARQMPDSTLPAATYQWRVASANEQWQGTPFRLPTPHRLTRRPAPDETSHPPGAASEDGTTPVPVPIVRRPSASPARPDSAAVAVAAPTADTPPYNGAPAPPDSVP